MKKQQLRNKYQLLLQNSNELILFFDERGYIVDCNQTAKIELGYGDEIYDACITDIFHKAVRFYEEQLIIQMKYQNRKAETVAYRRNQTCFVVELKIVLVPWAKKFHGVCMAEDISEKKRLIRALKYNKRELKTSNKIKNDFVANITHELRTPLNGIMGLTEYLLETDLDKSQQEILNIILRCGLNMNTLINDILDFAKFGNSKLVLENREFELRRFIDDTISCYVNRIKEKGLKLIVNMAEDIPDRLIGDERRLSQILNNLISNAIKFTSTGQISLEVVKSFEQKDEVELFFMVMDTGIGIRLEDRDKLFISFSQVDSSITRRFGGTGLGLSISRMLVEAMGGTISVESEHGKGSTFSFTIKLRVPNASGYEVKEEHLSSQNHNHTVLNAEEAYRGRNVDYIDVYLRDNDQKIDGNASPDYLYVKEECTEEQLVKKSLEKLKLCIEMENWEMAEATAIILKKQMPEPEKKLNQIALQLLLSIRKEENDKSMCVLKELEKKIREVTSWSI